MSRKKIAVLEAAITATQAAGGDPDIEEHLKGQKDTLEKQLHTAPKTHWL